MKEILGSPMVNLMTRTFTQAGTDATVSTGLTNSLDTRNYGANNIGAARWVSLAFARGTNSTNKTITFTIGHAASVTDAATNSTDLFSITRAGLPSTTDTLDRAEVEMTYLQPVLKLAVTSGSGGTAETIAISAVAVLGRQEQTPITKAMLATGTVVIYAAGATQSA